MALDTDMVGHTHHLKFIGSQFQLQGSQRIEWSVDKELAEKQETWKKQTIWEC